MKPRTFLTCLTLVFSVGLIATSTASADNGSNTYPGSFNKFDHNNDGKIGRREQAHAKRVRDRVDYNNDGKIGKHERYMYNRVDVNDDGRIGKREREYANNIRGNGDRNNDGYIGRKERQANHKFLNRVDRQR